MSGEEELYLNGSGRTKSIYQQPSTGEKHVLFYPTSPAPSVNSEERRSWCQASSSSNNVRNNIPISNNNSDGTLRMKKSEGAASDPPDSGGHVVATASSNPRKQDNSLHNGYNFKIGIYGWRKRCLYVIILVLLIIVIVNLALTLWVLKVMEFSSEGMGQLKIVTGGLRLEGKAFVLDRLIASSIKSRTGQPIIVESSRNLTLRARNKNGYLDSSIFIGNDRFECLANNFKVMDDRGMLLFSADKSEVVVGADSLRVTGEGGTTFSGSIQTTLVRAQSGHDLRLESPTRSLGIHAPKGIHIESRGGKIKTVALNDIAFKSEVGAIRLESSSVIMPSLPIAKISSRSSGASSSSQSSHHSQDIYQLCACENGKLFLASPHTVCASDNDDVFFYWSPFADCAVSIGMIICKQLFALLQYTNRKKVDIFIDRQFRPLQLGLQQLESNSNTTCESTHRCRT